MRLYLGSLLFVAIADTALLVAFLIYRRHQAKKRALHAMQLRQAELTSLQKGADMQARLRLVCRFKLPVSLRCL